MAHPPKYKQQQNGESVRITSRGASRWATSLPAARRQRQVRQRRREKGQRHRSVWQLRPSRGMLLAGAGAAVCLCVLAGGFVLLRGRPRGAPKEAEVAGANETSDPRTDAEVLRAAGEADEIARRIRTWDLSTRAVSDAQRFVAQGRFGEAEQRLEHALEASPDLKALHMIYARLLFHQNQYAEARDHVSIVLDGNPDDLPARMMLARMYAAEKNHDAVLTTAKWILEADPSSTEANRMAATAYMSGGQPSAAVPHLRKAIAWAGNDIDLKNQLANAYSHMGQYEKAIELLGDLLQEDGSYSVTHYNLAVCYARQSRVEAVIDVLQSAADRFGYAFISSWVESSDFERVQDADDFVRLRQRLYMQR